MFRGRTRAMFLRAEMASTELRKLVPLLPLKLHESKSSPLSIASLLASTAFASTQSHLPAAHSRDCPVVAKALPLSRVSIEPSFTARPCASCVRERVHYLASVVFCDDFEHRCRNPEPKAKSPDAEHTNKPVGVPGELQKAVEASFGSFAALRDSIRQLSISAMTPGRLWLVYRPSTLDAAGGSLHLLSFPGCKVPLAHGLWPLAVVNVSEERVCEELEQCTKGTEFHGAGGEGALPPPWSHAARTPGVSTAVEGRLAVERLRLADLQAAVAQKALSAMNWDFVAAQLALAQAYYTSTERASTQLEHRKAKEQLAAVRAMGRLKDSGAIIHAADSVTIAPSTAKSRGADSTAAAAAAATASLASVQAAATDAAHNAALPASAVEREVADEASEAATPLASSAPINASPHASVAKASSGVLPESAGTGAGAGAATPTAAPETAASEPRPVQQPDGTWEYHYANGDVTKVRKDGTKIFQTKDLTTTVFVNGDTLFAYPNNTSILDRADGVRVTTYADGTTKEERLR